MATKNNARKRLSPARKDTTLRRIESSVDKEEWAPILQLSGDERAHRLVEMLFDPAYRNHSLARLSERVGLKSRDLLQLFRQHYIDAALILAARSSLQVMKDTIESALNKTVVCHRCDGRLQVSGEDGTERLCPACKGSGTEVQMGDYRARQIVLESVGLIGKNRRSS